MRTPRDVSDYLAILERVRELDHAQYSEKSTADYGTAPPEVLDERNKFITGEIEYTDLSLNTKMWLSVESLATRRKDPILYSGLPSLLDQETWMPPDAMLILAGIDPDAAIMNWSYENFMGAEIRTPIIRHADWFTSKSDLYDYPIADNSELSSTEVKLKGLIRKAKSRSMPLSKAKLRLQELEDRVKEVKRWKQDKTSQFKSAMLNLRAQMVGILKRRWDSGDHDPSQRRSPAFFVQWAETRGFEIEWASWARENGYIDTEPPVSAPPFFDADAEDYPKLLHIAVRAWEHARKSSEGTAKRRITDFLQDRYPELSASEKESIALIGNWQKAGGRPRTGG